MKWDAIPPAVRKTVEAMTPDQVCEFLDRVLNQVAVQEKLLSERKLLADFVKYRAAKIFEAAKIDSLKMKHLGAGFYLETKTVCSSTADERDAFCRRPPKPYQEVAAFVKETVNASTFAAWCVARLKENKSIPDFVKRTDLVQVVRRRG